MIEYDFKDVDIFSVPEPRNLLGIVKILMKDKHDLIQKACGWMLREMGKRDVSVLKNFLSKYHKEMPRTMLRYSIEKFSNEEKNKWM